MKIKDISIVIVARDAEISIIRCLQSIRDIYRDQPVLIVDDSPDTKLKDVIPKNLVHDVRILKPPIHIGVGNARQFALENLHTLFGVWLDADDEIRAGRLERLKKQFEDKDVDLVYEAAELYSDLTGEHISHLPIPVFLSDSSNIVWNFERNWFPVLSGGFKTEVARSIGYDINFTACEDYDFLTRGLVKGVRVGIENESGINYFSRPNSVSRNRKSTDKFDREIIGKTPNRLLKPFLASLDIPEAKLNMILAVRAARCGQYESALELAKNIPTETELLSPYGWPLGDLSEYIQATAYFHIGDVEQAAEKMRHLRRLYPKKAEIWNNLAVCHAAQKQNNVEKFLEYAASLKPEFVDVVENYRLLEENKSLKWTNYPLRPFNTNSLYL